MSGHRPFTWVSQVVAVFRIYYHYSLDFLSGEIINQKFVLFLSPKVLTTHWGQNISFLISGVVLKQKCMGQGKTRSPWIYVW